jgi:hypothetical protein
MKRRDTSAPPGKTHNAEFIVFNLFQAANIPACLQRKQNILDNLLKSNIILYFLKTLTVSFFF